MKQPAPLREGGRGQPVRDPVAAIAEAYEAGETDEFIQPRIVVDEEGNPVAKLKDGDGVIFFNFRADRARQLSRALVGQARGGRPLGRDRQRPRPRVASRVADQSAAAAKVVIGWLP